MVWEGGEVFIAATIEAISHDRQIPTAGFRIIGAIFGQGKLIHLPILPMPHFGSSSNW
jgi:hypothetical protein